MKYSGRRTDSGSEARRLRIGILGPTYPFRGGIAHYTTLLASHLRRDHDVLLASFRRQYPPRLFPGRTDRDPSASVVADDAQYVLSPLRPHSWFSTARLLAEFEPDVLLIQWWVPFWAPSLGTVAALVRRWTDARVVFVCHNVLPHERSGAWDRQLARMALGRGHGFIVHSESDREALCGLLPDQTAPEGSVVRATLPAHTISEPVDRSSARDALGMDPADKVALFFGFVRPYKGLEHLIDALPLAMERVPDLRLLVAGEFWQPADQFVRRAESLGVGDRLTIDDRYVPNEEVGTYFAAADVIVMPYVAATQSGIVTLAAQFERPVIATDVGGLPEVVLDGVTGLVVPPADAGALADALARCLGDDQLAAQLRVGLAGSRERFGWSPLVATIESLAEPRWPPAAA
jgi:glycosyltransferase involved in cell wall biosynthesis